jgi:hypothetical protein
VGAVSIGTNESGDASGLAGAFRLARKEVRREWPSYPLTGLFLLLLGFFVVPSLSGVFEVDGSGAVGLWAGDHYNDFISDYLFLVVGAFLGVRAISTDYTLASWQDTYSSRLTDLCVEA